MEDTLLEEVSSHGTWSYVLARAFGIIGLSLVVVDAVSPESGWNPFVWGVASVLLGAAIERKRN